MRKLKQGIGLLFYNNWALIEFEILYKLLGIAVGVPFLYGVLTLTMKLAGFSYLTTHNVSAFVRDPLAIASGIIVVFIISLYVLFDGSAVLYLMAHACKQEKVSAYQAAFFACRNIRELLKPVNWGVLFHMIVLLPLLHTGVFASCAATVTIPHFITIFLEEHPRQLLLAAAAVLVIGWLFLSQIYVFHYFTIERCFGREAIIKSAKLSKKRRHKDAAALVSLQVLFYGCYSLFVMISIVLVMGGTKILDQLGLLTRNYTAVVWSLLVVVMCVVAAIGTPVAFICITVLFYLHKDSLNEELVHERIHVAPSDKERRYRIAELAIFIATSGICIGWIYYASSEKLIDAPANYLNSIEVTAHRGSSNNFPENTMAAFREAVREGTDWLELDVQKSRDGQIIVMHDFNFYRTAGVYSYCWDMDYQDILQLDAGSWRSEEFAGEHIPLLSEVLEFARENDVRLNVELKPAAGDRELAIDTVKLIDSYDYLDSCVITSQNYEVLEQLKEYDASIRTIYVLGFAYGMLTRLEAADGFSVEAGSITPGMVSRIHNAGKKIYAWTVNTRRTAMRMIDLHVDNIVTDRVPMALECIYSSKANSSIMEYVRFLRGL